MGVITMNPRKCKVNLNHRIFVLYKSAETCHPVSFPCKGTNILIFEVFTCGYDLYNHRYNFYTRGWEVFICNNVLWLALVFYCHRCNKFLHARMFFTLADTTYILIFAIYLHAQECFVHSLRTSSIPMGAMSELETCFEPV